MKTLTRDKVASAILKYLLHFIIIACFFIVLTYTFTSSWLHSLLNKYSNVGYIFSIDSDHNIAIQLGIYTMFCYFVNNFVFDLFHRNRAKQLTLSMAVDLLIMPLQIVIMVIYNNIVIKHTTAMEPSLYNVYLITGLIVVKEIIAGNILARAKASGGKMKYKSI